MALLDSIQKARPWRFGVASGANFYDGQPRAAARVLIGASGAVLRLLLASAFDLATKIQRDTGAATAYLDWNERTGFMGSRVTIGALSWAGQTPAIALAGLPRVLQEHRDRRQYCEVTCLTGTGSEPFDEEAHVRSASEICADYRDVVIAEIANEPYHATQSNRVHDFGYLARLGQYFDRYGIVWSSGAPSTDEPDPQSLDIRGPIVKIHLGRVRLAFEMVRHIRELEMASGAYNRHVFNGEPIGWDEIAEDGRRSNRPEIAFGIGVLSRGFELSLTSHSQAGLRSELPGPRAQTCHDALIRGYRCVPFTSRLRFANAGWEDSPIKAANFDGGILRAYSFIDDAIGMGVTVLVKVTGDPRLEFKNGWRAAGIVDEIASDPDLTPNPADRGTIRVLGISR